MVYRGRSFCRDIEKIRREAIATRFVFIRGLCDGVENYTDSAVSGVSIKNTCLRRVERMYGESEREGIKDDKQVSDLSN